VRLTNGDFLLALFVYGKVRSALYSIPHELIPLARGSSLKISFLCCVFFGHTFCFVFFVGISFSCFTFLI